MIAGFRSRNHPQQIARRGALEEVDDRALPGDAFAALQARFRFTIDAAASMQNRKVERYFDRESCGLRSSWAGERVYCNPPWSFLRPWVEKAWEARDAELAVLLLPANRTDQPWWQELIERRRDRAGSPLRVEFLPSRIRFLKPGQIRIQPNERPPHGCCLAIFAWDWDGRVA